jgi:predicted extracellular nuclease
MFMLDGKPLYVINNHFNAKGGDHSLFGAVQPPILSSEAQRAQQAQIVHNFVASILQIDPSNPGNRDGRLE